MANYTPQVSDLHVVCREFFGCGALADLPGLEHAAEFVDPAWEKGKSSVRKMRHPLNAPAKKRAVCHEGGWTAMSRGLAYGGQGALAVLELSLRDGARAETA